jgi:glycogen synthase
VRVVMLGWEFPPFISGGLGTACHGLSCAMGRLGTKVLFVLPEAIETTVFGAAAHAESAAEAPPAPRQVQMRRVPGTMPNPYGSHAASALQMQPIVEPPAQSPAVAAALRQLRSSPLLKVKGTGAGGGYGGDLLGKIHLYADRCLAATADEPFDIIHAHDWMTFPSGIRLARQHRKPLVIHVHATEFDRSGEHLNQKVYHIERAGMHAADAVIAVSKLTKNTVVRHYGVPASKVCVVYNGIDATSGAVAAPPRRREKVVLFLGRITRQKGPGLFLDAMQRVFAKCQDVRAVVAGWGDMGPWMTEQVAQRGMGSRVLFAGFLRGADVDRAFRMADVYVMPSISEPFGLTALESIRNGTPVVLSRTSGAAEVLKAGALAVDWWDTDRMAEQILAVLRYPDLVQMLRHHAAHELRVLTWEAAARDCIELYHRQVALPETVEHARPVPRVAAAMAGLS